MKPRRLFFAAVVFLVAGCQQPVDTPATPRTSVRPSFDEAETEAGDVFSPDTTDTQAVANGWIGSGH